MKFMKITLKDLYKFICHKIGKESDYDEFVKVPFELQIESATDYEPVKEFVKKKSKTVELNFLSGAKIKGADEHILMCSPTDTESGVFLKDIEPNTSFEEYDESLVDVKKSDEEEDVFSPVVSTNHLYKDAYGFLHHNTHSVKEALKDSWGRSPLRKQGYKLVEVKGSIGESMSPLITFFYINRNKRIIILDDCDGFLTATNQSIKNLCKAILDTDKASVTYPTTYAKFASAGVRDKIKRGEYDIAEENPDYVKALLRPDYVDPNYDPDYQYQESTHRFKIGTKRLLKENIIDLFIDDNYIGCEKVSEADKKLYLNGKKLQEARKDDYDEDFDIDDEDEMFFATNTGSDDPAGDAEELDMIPTQFNFNSRVILISNLTVGQVNKYNSAVASRCQTYEIHLTPMEFLARLGSILDGFDISKHSTLPKELIQKIKVEAFKMLSNAVNFFLAGQEVFGRKVVLKRQLQFRMISDLASKFLQKANKYCRLNGMTLSADNFDEVTENIEARFMLDVMDYLASND